MRTAFSPRDSRIHTHRPYRSCDYLSVGPIFPGVASTVIARSIALVTLISP
jgi:hypothetical protein